MIYTLEPRPPAATAVKYDGSNADELAIFTGLAVPAQTVGTEADGPETEGQPVVRLNLNGWPPELDPDTGEVVNDYAMPVRVGDYVVRQPNGGLMHYWPETVAQQFRVVDK